MHNAGSEDSVSNLFNIVLKCKTRQLLSLYFQCRGLFMDSGKSIWKNVTLL